jgi:hypothetical protein
MAQSTTQKSAALRLSDDGKCTSELSGPRGPEGTWTPLPLWEVLLIFFVRVSPGGPTRLTQARRSAVKAGNLVASTPRIPQVKARCPLCGSVVTTGSAYCAKCVTDVNRENLLRQAKLGQIATHSAVAEARRSATQARQADALRQWNPADLPKWFDEDVYRREMLPRLSKFTVRAIRLKLSVSHPYATLIKRGDSIPHPSPWLRLAELAGYRR